MMPEILAEYFSALARLKAGCPERIEKSVQISKDAVSLEAGRKKGTIKKSRAIFRDLILAIEAAAAEQSYHQKRADRLPLLKEEAAKYRELWEEALSREISLVNQLWRERREWALEKQALTGKKVSVIHDYQHHWKDDGAAT
jgi:hypothetical protein